MTVFKAVQPVSLTASKVASLFGFLSHNPVIEVANGNELKVETHGGSIEVDFRSVPGHPFTYGLHGPTGGLLASLQVNTPAGSIAFKFSHMAAPMATLVSDVQHSQWGAALSLLLPGHDTITGSAGNDHLADFNGHDRITGGAGHDLMTGAAGNDTFVFKAGFGMDKINHFIAGDGANHDIIELDHVPGILNFHQMMNHHVAVVGGQVVISDTMGDSITLTNVHSKLALTFADFHIHA